MLAYQIDELVKYFWHLILLNVNNIWVTLEILYAMCQLCKENVLARVLFEEFDQFVSLSLSNTFFLSCRLRMYI